jgi:hypothetical protein
MTATSCHRLQTVGYDIPVLAPSRGGGGGNTPTTNQKKYILKINNFMNHEKDLFSLKV